MTSEALKTMENFKREKLNCVKINNAEMPELEFSVMVKRNGQKRYKSSGEFVSAEKAVEDALLLVNCFAWAESVKIVVKDNADNGKKTTVLFK